MSSDENRWLPTATTLSFVQQLIQSALGPLSSEAVDRFGKDAPQIEQIKQAYSSMHLYPQLVNTGLVPEPPEPLPIENAEPSLFMKFDPAGWSNLVLQDAVSFDRYGADAAGSVAEVMLKASAVGRRIGGAPLLYRGEHQYGYPLLSRVGRRFGEEPAWGSISAEELEALDTFRQRVGADPGLQELIGDTPSTPMGWLAAMQHYDEDFATRMLDVSTSVFAGLYFACVDWNGRVDTGHDGRLYCFQGRGVKRRYVPPAEWDAATSDEQEVTDRQPMEERDLFGLEYPDVYRVVVAPERNERLLAQDGFFILPAAPGTGWGQNFEIRIPAEAKRGILVELWQAGYTPERIVRGPKGAEAHSQLKQTLGGVIY